MRYLAVLLVFLMVSGANLAGAQIERDTNSRTNPNRGEQFSEDLFSDTLGPPAREPRVIQPLVAAPLSAAERSAAVLIARKLQEFAPQVLTLGQVQPATDVVEAISGEEKGVPASPVEELAELPTLDRTPLVTERTEAAAESPAEPTPETIEPEEEPVAPLEAAELPVPELPELNEPVQQPTELLEPPVAAQPEEAAGELTPEPLETHGFGFEPQPPQVTTPSREAEPAPPETDSIPPLTAAEPTGTRDALLMAWGQRTQRKISQQAAELSATLPRETPPASPTPASLAVPEPVHEVAAPPVEPSDAPESSQMHEDANSPSAPPEAWPTWEPSLRALPEPAAAQAQPEPTIIPNEPEENEIDPDAVLSALDRLTYATAEEPASLAPSSEPASPAPSEETTNPIPSDEVEEPPMDRPEFRQDNPRLRRPGDRLDEPAPTEAEPIPADSAVASTDLDAPPELTRPIRDLGAGFSPLERGRAPLEMTLSAWPPSMPPYEIDVRVKELARGNTREKVVALTFDDGPHPEFTSQLVAVLEYYDVPATFFFVGVQAQKHPQWVKMVYQGGHEIASQTYDHFRMPKLPRDEKIYQIDEYQRLIEGLTGQTPRFLRPPGGQLDDETRALLQEREMVLALWDVALNDTGEYKTSQELLSVSLSRVRPGSVLLAHDGIQATVDMLPELIETLRAQGYEFVTMSELASKSK